MNSTRVFTVLSAEVLCSLIVLPCIAQVPAEAPSLQAPAPVPLEVPPPTYHVGAPVFQIPTPIAPIQPLTKPGPIPESMQLPEQIPYPEPIQSPEQTQLPEPVTGPINEKILSKPLQPEPRSPGSGRLHGDPVADHRAHEKPFGYISADLPWVVTAGEQFKIDVFLVPSEPTQHQPVTVYMEQTDLVLYEPQSVTVIPGERITVQAKILRSSGGLSQIIATAPGWIPLWVTIDSGFRAGLSLTLPNTVDSGTISSFSVQFADEATGKLVPLEAPTSLVVEATSAEIRHGDGPWSRVLKVELAPGANSSPVLELKPIYWPPGRGTLKAELRINSQRIIADKVVEFSRAPSWWTALMMAAVGGLLWSLYSITKDFKTITAGPRRRLVTQWALTLFGGFFAGCLAYLLASWDVLGIRVDTTSLKGFVFLGFLVAYVGVDSLMKGVSSKVTGKT